MKRGGMEALLTVFALLLAGCGGGAAGDPAGTAAGTSGDGSSGDSFSGSVYTARALLAPGAPASDLQLTGTTAPAMADGRVEAKCASGNGSGTTDANGAFTVAVGRGLLPCVVRMTGEVDGAPVTLHSVALAGMPNGGGPAIVNVTPLTEMIIAKLTGTLPAALYDSFPSGLAQISRADLQAASDLVVEALGAFTGLDLGGIDPFAGQSIAAPGQGNAYDVLLEELLAQVDIGMLPQIVNRIATAADDIQALIDALTLPREGSLVGCAAAVSGKYRFLAYSGHSWAADFDFERMEIFERTFDVAPIKADLAQPCRFVIENSIARIEVVIGPAGVGAWRMQLADGSAEPFVGYIFPVQSHSLASLAGNWTVLISGHAWKALGHHLERMELDAAGVMDNCAYRTWDWSCEPYPSDLGEFALTPAGDDGFAFKGLPVSWRFYAYQAPNGAMVLFGASHPMGPEASNMQVLVGSRLNAVRLPTFGERSGYWEIGHVAHSAYAYTSTPPAPRESMVLAADASARSYTSLSLPEGATNTVRLDVPIPGLRLRSPCIFPCASIPGVNGVSLPEAGAQEAGTLPDAYQFPLPDLGFEITFSTDAAPKHAYAISVMRP